MSPSEIRNLIRENKFNKPTAGVSKGYAQGNLVVLPKKYAYDFLLYAQRNPKPCPILEVLDEGVFNTRTSACGSDIRTDIPLYRVYEKGQLTGEYSDIKDLWRDDFVSFILGCSFTFESALVDEGITVRHIEQGCNVPMYITNIECDPAGIFSGPTVVSMRPIKSEDLVRTIKITSRYPAVHGAPIHVGDSSKIGIKDISKPDFGDAVEIKEGEIPVFWACGVTPQAAAMRVKPDIMITHSPGYMFVTDIKNCDLAVN